MLSKIKEEAKDLLLRSITIIYSVAAVFIVFYNPFEPLNKMEGNSGIIHAICLSTVFFVYLLYKIFDELVSIREALTSDSIKEQDKVFDEVMEPNDDSNA